MTTTSKCRAQDPATCLYHGNRQLGVKAAERIRAVLTVKPERYYLSDTELRTVPLKKMTATALALTIQNFARDNGLDVAKFDSAINTAADLHRKDLRANRGRYPRTPYIEHPLRNAVRLIRFGCTDESTLLATILHDTVEDHAREMSRKYAGHKTPDEMVAREHAFTWVGDTYGVATARVLRGMSTEMMPREASELEKNKIYRRHVLAVIEDPDVCASKVVDLIDNGGSLHHTLPTMSAEGVQRRTQKYLSVWDDVIARVKRDVFEEKMPISTAGRIEMVEQLERAQTMLIGLRDNQPVTV